MSGWMKGETATHEQVLEYFKLRKVKVDAELENQKREQERIKQMKAQARSNAQNFAFGGTVAFRSIENEEPFTNHVRLIETMIREENFHLPVSTKALKPSTLVSGLPAVGFLRACGEAFEKLEVQPTFNDKKFKLEATIPTDLGKVKMGINWLEYEGLNCAEFVRKEGDLFEFNENVQKFKNFFNEVVSQEMGETTEA